MTPGFRLYLITDRRLNSDLEGAVRAALEGGARCVQLREKDLPVRGLLDMAKRLRSVTAEFGARLFINGRVDVALAVEADGVHLGGNSIPADAARKICGERLMIGVSTHSVEEAVAAREAGADFVTFGPVYETPSKMAYGKKPLGLPALSLAAERAGIPVFAIGGVKTGNVREVMDAGAYGAALISAVFGADDIRTEANKFMRTLE
ncbi:MAG: thiamine phosphate synthase [Nitrospiraceae bacterium]|nr:thiamine phosphate synthase [Nitrospiraceae bacterium]